MKRGLYHSESGAGPFCGECRPRGPVLFDGSPLNWPHYCDNCGRPIPSKLSPVGVDSLRDDLAEAFGAIGSDDESERGNLTELCRAFPSHVLGLAKGAAGKLAAAIQAEWPQGVGCWQAQSKEPFGPWQVHKIPPGKGDFNRGPVVNGHPHLPGFSAECAKAIIKFWNESGSIPPPEPVETEDYEVLGVFLCELVGAGADDMTKGERRALREFLREFRGRKGHWSSPSDDEGSFGECDISGQMGQVYSAQFVIMGGSQ